MSSFKYVFGAVVFEDMPETSAGGAMFLEDMPEPSDGGATFLEDMPGPSDGGEMTFWADTQEPFAGGAMTFWEDMLKQSGGGAKVEGMLDLLSGIGGTMEDLQGLPINSFLGGDSSINLNASTPGTPVQPPPPVASISNPCSPPNPCAVPEQVPPKPYIEVSILDPPLERRDRISWTETVASMLPDDILRKAPRKRGEGKYFASGQKYKPCSWEKFIERVNEKINAGKLKAIAKRPMRRRQIRAAEEVTDPVIVALQAQAEIYGEHFNAATFFTWD